MNSQQQAFLQHVGTLIPKLFDAIRLGNVKSECVLGDRLIGQRQVRLKLVAEVVDPGSNPLATHSQTRQNQVPPLNSVKRPNQSDATNQAIVSNQNKSANQSDPSPQDNTTDHSNPLGQPVISNQAEPTPPRRGSRRKHPMSR